MSDNEKKLLTLFAIAGFAILNLFGFKYAQSLKGRTASDLSAARAELEKAEMIQASREQVTEEMDWLAENEPEPKASQDVQTGLQQLAEREARSTNLVIKSQKPQATVADEGAHYHRAMFQFVVSGTDESLYRWFDRLNDPSKFRIVSQMRLSPNAQDDTKIDCTATIEQWFIPQVP